MTKENCTHSYCQHYNEEFTSNCIDFNDLTKCDLKKYIDILLDDSIFLNALRAAGVDNWQGYEIAIDMMEEDEKN